MIKIFNVEVNGQGLHDITAEINDIIHNSHTECGLCTVFIQHTSASLLIQENADPAARHDLENWLNRLVPAADPLYTHTSEGPDDMPSHIKSTLTQTTLVIPVIHRRLALGTWQGIFLWEHRHHSGPRTLIIHISAD